MPPEPYKCIGSGGFYFANTGSSAEFMSSGKIKLTVGLLLKAVYALITLGYTSAFEGDNRTCAR
jgi:hypothetical protein